MEIAPLLAPGLRHIFVTMFEPCKCKHPLGEHGKGSTNFIKCHHKGCACKKFRPKRS